MTARLLVLVMLLAPLLGDALASACAKAPCCAMKNGSCPMHQSKGSGCRMTSCSHSDIALAQTPPAVHRATFAPHRDSRAVAIPRAEVMLVAHVTAPPDPPPPRVSGSLSV